MKSKLRWIPDTGTTIYLEIDGVIRGYVNRSLGYGQWPKKWSCTRFCEAGYAYNFASYVRRGDAMRRVEREAAK